MKILFDSHIFANQKIGGISRYHYELAAGLQAKGHQPFIAGKFIKNHYLLSNKLQHQCFISDTKAIFSGLNSIIIKSYLRKSNKFDIFHPTDTREYLLKSLPKNKPMVFTIHDMIPELLDNIDPFATSKYKFAQRASKIIAVSENTKNDIINIFNIPSEKIDVIYHGSSLFPDPKKHSNLKIPHKYLLFLGGRSRYKNFDFFVQAISPLLNSNKNLSLVCAGGKPFTEVEKSHIKELSIENQVICYTQLSDSELAFLYTNSLAFIFPSIYEGFGIPILEAWACKTPVLLSQASCFPEIASDGALYFNPQSISSIQETINSVISNDELRTNLINIGLQNLKNFNWNKTVNQTIQTYQSVL